MEPPRLLREVKADLMGHVNELLVKAIDQDKLEYFAVEQRDVYDTVSLLLGGVSVGYSHRGEGRDPIEIFGAYLVARLPATFAAIDAVFSELARRRPDFAPRSLLDAVRSATGLPGLPAWRDNAPP